MALLGWGALLLTYGSNAPWGLRPRAVTGLCQCNRIYREASVGVNARVSAQLFAAVQEDTYTVCMRLLW
jgi:hypothetical protein